MSSIDCFLNIFHFRPEGEVSLADIVAERKREAKRKKRKFRKTKPTRIEEVRALVQLQMQALQQFVENRDGKQVAIKTEKDDNVRKPNESWDFSHRKEAEQNHNTRSKHEERYQYKHRSTTKDNNKYNQEISFSKTHRKPEKCQENKDRTRNLDPYSSKYKSSEDYTSNKATEKGYRRNSRSPRRSNQSLKFEKEYDKRFRKLSRSPEHSRSISKKPKDYTKYRETDVGESNSKKHKDYDKYREAKKD